MSFFNLQIFAFSDQMYMSLKNTKAKNKPTFPTSNSVKGWIAAEVSEPDPADTGTT